MLNPLTKKSSDEPYLKIDVFSNFLVTDAQKEKISFKNQFYHHTGHFGTPNPVLARPSSLLAVATPILARPSSVLAQTCTGPAQLCAGPVLARPSSLLAVASPVLARPSSVLALYWPDPALEKLKRMLPKLVYWSNLPQRNPIQSTSNLELCNSRDGKDMICNYLMLLYQKNIRYYMFNMSYPFFYRTLLTVYFLKNYKNT